MARRDGAVIGEDVFFCVTEFAVRMWSSLTAMATNSALSGVSKASLVFKTDLRVVAFGTLCGREFLLGFS